jgi:hypothetical protein
MRNQQNWADASAGGGGDARIADRAQEKRDRLMLEKVP